MPLVAWNDTLALFSTCLPPGASCPGATDLCRSYCYARRGKMRLATVLAGHEENLRRTHESLHDGPLGFARMMTEAVLDKGAAVVRIHSAGDFISPEHIIGWGLTVAAMRQEPYFDGFRAFAYTRVWRLDRRWTQAMVRAVDIADGGLLLWASSDAETGEPDWPLVANVSDKALRGKSRAGIASMAGTVLKPNCKKQTEHLNCAKCRLCFAPHLLKPTRQDGLRHVVFLQH